MCLKKLFGVESKQADEAEPESNSTINNIRRRMAEEEEERNKRLGIYPSLEGPTFDYDPVLTHDPSHPFYGWTDF